MGVELHRTESFFFDFLLRAVSYSSHVARSEFCISFLCYKIAYIKTGLSHMSFITLASCMNSMHVGKNLRDFRLKNYKDRNVNGILKTSGRLRHLLSRIRTANIPSVADSCSNRYKI